MEETLSSPKMAEIDLIKNLEKISSEIPNRILKIQGYILKKNHKEQLEICLLYTSPSPRDRTRSRMPSSA